MLRVIALTIWCALAGLACEGKANLSATIDPNLPSRTIAVDGKPEVGETLHARISPDLEGKIVSWGWHRCNDVPFCLTIPGADESQYKLSKSDAWQVIRVIAVATRTDGPPGGVSTVVGPIVEPSPQAFIERKTISPGLGLILVVADGRVEVDISAACPVSVGATISTPGRESTKITAQEIRETPSQTHHLVLDGDGGQLLVFGLGECDLDVTVNGSR